MRLLRGQDDSEPEQPLPYWTEWVMASRHGWTFAQTQATPVPVLECFALYDSVLDGVREQQSREG